jgi:putative transposase
MKKSRYTEEQIAFALKQAETGTPVSEVIRRMGFRSRRFTVGRRCTAAWRWLAKAPEADRGQNRQLKQLVADMSLDKHIQQDVLSKKLRRLDDDANSSRTSRRPMLSANGAVA